MTTIRGRQQMIEVADVAVAKFTSIDDFEAALHRGKDILYAEISASVASGILERFNQENRRRDEIAVQRYRRDMDGDRWQSDGEIGFGVLAGVIQLGDGQHRMAAQVASGTAQRYRVRVFTDSDEFAQYVITRDGGRPRSLADHLKIFGVAENSGAAGLFERVTNAMQNFLGQPASRYSKQERFEFAIEHKPAIQYVLGLPKRQFKAHLLAAIALAYPKRPSVIREFIQRVIQGADLKAGSPELELSKHLAEMNDARNGKAKDRAMGQMIRVLHDVTQNRSRTAILRARVDSIHEAIASLVSKGAAEMWASRQKGA